MKKAILFILIVFSLVLFGYVKQTRNAQQKREHRKMPKMCETWIGAEAPLIFPCKDSHGRTIYLQLYTGGEDFPSHYFDAQGVFLGECDPWKLGENGICRDESIKCEFDKNLFEEFCKK